MYFAKRWDRPPFAPELPSKNWDFGAPSLVLCRPASPVLAHCRYGRPLFLLLFILLLILLGLFFASLFARMSGPSSASKCVVVRHFIWRAAVGHDVVCVVRTGLRPFVQVTSTP